MRRLCLLTHSLMGLEYCPRPAFFYQKLISTLIYKNTLELSLYVVYLCKPEDRIYLCHLPMAFLLCLVSWVVRKTVNSPGSTTFYRWNVGTWGIENARESPGSEIHRAVLDSDSWGLHVVSPTKEQITSLCASGQRPWLADVTLLLALLPASARNYPLPFLGVGDLIYPQLLAVNGWPPWPLLERWSMVRWSSLTCCLPLLSHCIVKAGGFVYLRDVTYMEKNVQARKPLCSKRRNFYMLRKCIYGTII